MEKDMSFLGHSADQCQFEKNTQRRKKVNLVGLVPWKQYNSQMVSRADYDSDFELHYSKPE